jgi:glycosyltransferase involved in cell wall biosynthesis
MSTPMVTILMPAYNAAVYIGEAIKSVLEQSFTDFELLVIDDGSADDTAGIVRKFADQRIIYLQQTHQGIAYALNRGLKEAKGKFIARFDADDVCMPNRLQKQVEFLTADDRYVLCGCDAEYISESGDHLFNFTCIGHSHEEIHSQLYVLCPFIHSSVMYRKEAVIAAGGYSLHAHNFEDYLLWVQLASYGRYANLPEQLIRVRFNPASVTIDEKWRGYRFRQLKRKIILKGSITPDEGDELQGIIQNQDTQKIKKGAYYALCGKKFLVNNHQPSKARTYFSKAILIHPLRWDNYAFYLLSYFPQGVISWLYRIKPI